MQRSNRLALMVVVWLRKAPARAGPRHRRPPVRRRLCLMNSPEIPRVLALPVGPLVEFGSTAVAA